MCSGRASQRLQEMAGLPSSTIHRLLQYKAAGMRRAGASADDEDDLEGSYTFNRSNPLPADAVLVDEAAMLDLPLSAALLEALPLHCQLLLVGESARGRTATECQQSVCTATNDGAVDGSESCVK